jgi:arsenate reductase
VDQPVRKKRILFVCIGNMCRSPMAEALARHYGADVLDATSAGIAPALGSSPLTRSTLSERNIDLGDQLPRSLNGIDISKVDLVVNMSGSKLGLPPSVRVEEWNVRDPVAFGAEVYRDVCRDLEMRVMNLILRMRAGKI